MKKLDPNYIKAAIVNKGGTLLSGYKNSRTKIKVQCGNNHIWETTWNRVQGDHWCPECSKSINRKVDFADEVKAIVKAGTEAARAEAAKTMVMVKEAMKINY